LSTMSYIVRVIASTRSRRMRAVTVTASPSGCAGSAGTGTPPAPRPSARQPRQDRTMVPPAARQLHYRHAGGPQNEQHPCPAAVACWSLASVCPVWVPYRRSTAGGCGLRHGVQRREACADLGEFVVVAGEFECLPPRDRRLLTQEQVREFPDEARVSTAAMR